MVNDSDDLMIQQLKNYLTSLYGGKQFSTKPTCDLESSDSCIGIIFNNDTNTFMDSEVRLLLHEKCYN